MADESKRPDLQLIGELRALADRGTTVRGLAQTIQDRLNIQPDAILPILWYFKRAFALPLVTVLPIREWLGTDNDAEIDAVILPAIARARGKWAPTSPQLQETSGYRLEEDVDAIRKFLLPES